MEQRTGLSGCQVVGIILAILLVAFVCMATGLVLGGGIGLITGGTAGYAIGRVQSTHIEPHIEVPMPYPPGDEGWESPDFPLPPSEDEEWEPPEQGPEMDIYPCLGLRYETVAEGARIVALEPSSPARQAGLRERDVIAAVDGALVGEGHPDLATRILEHAPGDEVELSVQRGSTRLEREVTLGMRLGFESLCLPE